MGGTFEVPEDTEVRIAGAVALGALAFLVLVSRAFRGLKVG